MTTTLLLAYDEPGDYVASLMPNAEVRNSRTHGATRINGTPTRLARRSRAGPRFDRVLATVLFTDIVGSTERLAEVGDAAWRSLIARHDERAHIEIDATGAFRRLDGRRRLRDVRWSGSGGTMRDGHHGAIYDLGIQIRAGVHTGEIELEGDAVRGLAVHVGARVSSLAGPSGILVSQTVKDLVAGSGLIFEDAGEHDLKGVPDRLQLYGVVS